MAPGRRWRIYYADGSTYDVGHGPVEQAPRDGVIVIVQQDDEVGDPYATGRTLLYAKDHYWWDGDRWFGGDDYGKEDYLRRPGWKKVVSGRTVTDAMFGRIKARAETDPDFPRATARV